MNVRTDDIYDRSVSWQTVGISPNPIIRGSPIILADASQHASGMQLLTEDDHHQRGDDVNDAEIAVV